MAARQGQHGGPGGTLKQGQKKVVQTSPTNATCSIDVQRNTEEKNTRQGVSYACPVAVVRRVQGRCIVSSASGLSWRRSTSSRQTPVVTALAR